MPVIWLQRSGVALPRKHIFVLRGPPQGDSPSQKKSMTGHAPLPRLCVAGWPECPCISLSGDGSEKSRSSRKAGISLLRKHARTTLGISATRRGLLKPATIEERLESSQRVSRRRRRGCAFALGSGTPPRKAIEISSWQRPLLQKPHWRRPSRWA